MARKPNILFVFSDQHRHDVLGCAGHPLVQTPNLDRLADWGMRFERTWSQCPVCMPCRATMITGRYAHELGFTSNVTARHGDTVSDSPFKPAWPTIMKQLQGGGYETASIGKTHYHGRPGSMQARERGERFDTRQFEDFVKRFGWDYVMEEYDRYGHVPSHVNSPYMDFLQARGLLDAHQGTDPGYLPAHAHTLAGRDERVATGVRVVQLHCRSRHRLAAVAQFREALLSPPGLRATACPAAG